ncbi:hypothetical protein WJX72_006054 [[Myrmecia] bisecta]|uniref:glycerophosphodiester phosphodiesterase n=1 Tax=[Myrmecia] bisecta TaxID=41462 RepID=A0AAW1PCN9_9CHLO
MAEPRLTYLSWCPNPTGFLLASGPAPPGTVLDARSAIVGRDTACAPVGLGLHSRFSNALWATSTSHPAQAVRLAGMVLISIILVTRSYRLFLRWDARTVLLLASLCPLLPWMALPLAIFGLAFLAWQLRQQPEINAGHRSGAGGFKGPHCENTLEALADLIERDNGAEGPLAHLHYVEFDIHETADNKLVVLHDLGSVWHASKDAQINAAVGNDLQKQGVNIAKATAKDVTAAQLQTIHVGGRKGVRVPTLSQYLRCCQQLGLRRSIAVEIKSIWSDSGRAKFVELLRDYKLQHCLALEAACPERKYGPFGWVAAISFPFFFAPSFGEFGSAMWKEWGLRFRHAGIPARCCVLHSLDLLRGL